ncbi:MAG TPA: biopolymer transporter ExbD [Xanthomonadales bacterium]|nr:biopolymer transporter ExbD [Xanthomonadales bacterium]
MTHATARRDSLAEINITPLVDVMLVLLVIFMITAPVLAQRIDLDINGAPDKSPEVTTVQALEVQADGSVRWDGVLLPADAIAAQMRLAARDDTVQLRVTAAQGTPYENVAPVLGEARAAGIDSIDLALGAR